MKKIKCLVVEDEPLATKILTDYISQVPFLQLAGTCKDAIYAAAFLQKNKTDLIFLDIHLPKLKGMAFLKTLKDPPAVIITTAYHQYAVESYELNVTDYLLKPFEFERFFAAVNKVRTGEVSGSQVATTSSRQYLFLTINRKNVKINYQDILYIESMREYVKVVTPEGIHTCKLSTAEMETLLPKEHFIKVHRSYIVAADKIKSYSSSSLDINGIQIPVGRTFRHLLNKL